MTPIEKKHVRNIIRSLLEVHNLQETGIIEYLTCNRFSRISQLHGQDLITVASYLSDINRKEEVRKVIFDMLLDIEEFLTRKELESPWLNYTMITTFLKRNGFEGELFSLTYEELLQAKHLIARLHNSRLLELSLFATSKLLKELSIPVISTSSKKRNNETINKSTTK